MSDSGALPHPGPPRLDDDALARLLDIESPAGSGRFVLRASAPWPGVTVAAEAQTGQIAVALPDEVLLAPLADLGSARAVRVPDAWSLAFASGRRTLCIAGRGGLHVADIDDPHPVRVLGTPGPALLAASPGGSRIALAGQVAHPRASVGCVDLDRGRLDWTARVPDAASVAWCGPEILAVAAHGIHLFAYDGRVLPRLGAERWDALCGWGRNAVAAGRTSVAMRWDVDDTRRVAALPVPTGVGRRSLTTDGVTIAAGTLAAGGALALVSVSEGRVLRLIHGARAAAFMEERLVTTGPAGTHVWEWDPTG